jgi:DNA (cytosine-5)-methyltransferase 1
MAFTFIDLFSGIGGFRIGLESAGGQCIGCSEISKSAIDVYNRNWSDSHNFGDITEIESLPTHDIMCGGVPCQSWSIAGNMQGFEDSRGKLWEDVIRLLSQSQPKAFIFENVKGLADPRNNSAIEFLTGQFKNVGYDVRYKVLNANDYGVPQNRERVFIIGAKNLDSFSWPEPEACNSTLMDYIDDGKDLKNEYESNSSKYDNGVNDFFIFSDIRQGEGTIHSWDLQQLSSRQKDICMTLLTNRRSKKYGLQDGNPMSYFDLSTLIANLQLKEIEELLSLGILSQIGERFDFKNRRQLSGINGVYRIFAPNAKRFATLTASGTADSISTKLILGDTSVERKEYFIEHVYKTGSYRNLTDREAARIQGFPDKHLLHHSKSTNIKLIGNSVPPTVVEKIAKKLICFLD